MVLKSGIGCKFFITSQFYQHAEEGLVATLLIVSLFWELGVLGLAIDGTLIVSPIDSPVIRIKEVLLSYVRAVLHPRRGSSRPQYLFSHIERSASIATKINFRRRSSAVCNWGRKLNTLEGKLPLPPPLPP